MDISARIDVALAKLAGGVFQPPDDGHVTPRDNPYESGTPEWTQWRAEAERYNWDQPGDIQTRPEQHEWVPTQHLEPMLEWDRNVHGDPERVNAVAQSLLTKGFRNPVWIDFNPDTNLGHISEGNHRLTAALQAGIPAVPISVYRSGRHRPEVSRHYQYVGPERDHLGQPRPPQYMLPSDIGMPTTEPWVPQGLAAQQDQEADQDGTDHQAKAHSSPWRIEVVPEQSAQGHFADTEPEEERHWGEYTASGIADIGAPNDPVIKAIPKQQPQWEWLTGDAKRVERCEHDKDRDRCELCSKTASYGECPNCGAWGTELFDANPQNPTFACPKCDDVFGAEHLQNDLAGAAWSPQGETCPQCHQPGFGGPDVEYQTKCPHCGFSVGHEGDWESVRGLSMPDVHPNHWENKPGLINPYKGQPGSGLPLRNFGPPRQGNTAYHCPNCGSGNVSTDNYHINNEQYDCLDCGHSFGSETALGGSGFDWEMKQLHQPDPSHPDPWMDNEPGTLQFPRHWAKRYDKIVETLDFGRMPKTAAQLSVMYHVAPQQHREQIQRQGIVTQQPRPELPSGAYLFHDYDNADHFKDYKEGNWDQWDEGEPHDMWQVNADGLAVQPDPDIDPDDEIQSEYPIQPIGASYSAQPIPPERLRLVTKGERLGRTTDYDRQRGKCQTPGAVYNTQTSPDEVVCTVELPHSFNLSEEKVVELEDRIHDAMEEALAPLFEQRESKTAAPMNVRRYEVGQRFRMKNGRSGTVIALPKFRNDYYTVQWDEPQFGVETGKLSPLSLTYDAEPIEQGPGKTAGGQMDYDPAKDPDDEMHDDLYSGWSNAHDYDPRWDYGDELQPHLQTHPLVQQAQQHLDQSGERGRVFAADLSTQNAVGTYVHGTQGEPVILVDPTAHEQLSESPEEARDQMGHTVAHELRHVQQERNAGGEPDWDEEDAENG